jgi:hypothetical protein
VVDEGLRFTGSEVSRMILRGTLVVRRRSTVSGVNAEGTCINISLINLDEGVSSNDFSNESIGLDPLRQLPRIFSSSLHQPTLDDHT